MTKTDLIDIVARKAKLSPSAALEAVNAFTEEITIALLKGDKVTFKDFITLDLSGDDGEEVTHPKTAQKTTTISVKALKPESKKPMKPAAKEVARPQAPKKTAQAPAKAPKPEVKKPLKQPAKELARPQAPKKTAQAPAKAPKPEAKKPLKKSAKELAPAQAAKKAPAAPVKAPKPEAKETLKHAPEVVTPPKPEKRKSATPEKAPRPSPDKAVKEPPLTGTASVAALGARYKCYKCGTKFYDLGKPQPLCPSCGANQNDDEAKGVHKKKRKRRSYPMVKADPTITAPEESEDMIEVVNEVDAEYALDMDDIVIEESEDADKSY